jgi:hypothetical protein
MTRRLLATLLLTWRIGLNNANVVSTKYAHPGNQVQPRARGWLTRLNQGAVESLAVWLAAAAAVGCSCCTAAAGASASGQPAAGLLQPGSAMRAGSRERRAHALPAPPAPPGRPGGRPLSPAAPPPGPASVRRADPRPTRRVAEPSQLRPACVAHAASGAKSGARMRPKRAFSGPRPFTSRPVCLDPAARAQIPGRAMLFGGFPPALPAAVRLSRPCGGVTTFAWLISHQPTLLFSQNKPVTSNQSVVLFSQNKPTRAISHQPTEQVGGLLPATRILAASPLPCAIGRVVYAC